MNEPEVIFNEANGITTIWYPRHWCRAQCQQWAKAQTPEAPEPELICIPLTNPRWGSIRGQPKENAHAKKENQN